MARIIVVAALLLCVACGGEDVVQTRTVSGEPGRQYEVDDEFLYLSCAGHGSPTVVLEAGLGGDHAGWDSVQPELARRVRVCSYDRAGLSFSQAAPKRATAREKVRDLEGLLRAAGEEGPFVLVGHSYGGMLVRVYAAEHPDDVAGVVLLDSSHPDQGRRFLAALPPPRAGESAGLRALRADVHDASPPNPEGADFEESADEARGAGSLGERPLLVVTAGQMDWPQELPTGLARRLNRAWLAMQADLARLSTNRVHVVAAYSPHLVMSNLGQPELVVHAIGAVVNAASEHRRLPACRALFSPPGARCVD